MSVQTAEKVRIFDPTVWVDRHGDYLYALAFSRVRSESAAEELVREALLSAKQGWQSLPENQSERRWLTGILKNKVIDYLRRRCARTALTAEESEMSLDQYLFADKIWNDHWSAESAPVEWSAAPDEVLKKSEFCELLESCLNELPERVVYAFMLHERERLGDEEICAILRVSMDGYRSMLHRARTHLRRCLEYGWFRKIEAKGEIY